MTKTNSMVEELKRAGLFDKDSDYDGMLGKAVKELIDVFEKQGHSGYSAMATASIFHRLVKGEVLSPLTSNPDEWMDVSDNQWQNRRCSAVFSKDKTFKTGYWIDGKVFREKNGSCYTSGKSFVDLKFPCMLPKQEIIDVDK